MISKTLFVVTLSLCVSGGATDPVLIQSPSVEHVTEGQTARLQCSMQNAAVRDRNVYWYRELPGKQREWILVHYARNNVYRYSGYSERFQPSRHIDSNSFILTISNVQPSDTAVYYCSMRGGIYGNGSRLNVTSANAPVLIQSPSVEHVTEGQTARLQCTMQNATVRYTNVHWNRERPGKQREWILLYRTQNGTERYSGLSERFLPSRDIDSNSFILTISNVQPSDTAVYYCSVWLLINGNGSRLNVTSANAPVLIQSPSLERVTEGQTARLQCTMQNAAVTHTDVHWNRELPGKDMERVLTHAIKNNTQRSPGFTERFHPSRDTSNKTFILTISNVQPNDTAVYYCSVWGDISGNGSQLNVTINETPADQVPMLIPVYVILAAGPVLIGGILVTICLKKRSASSGRAGDQSQAAGDRNPRWTGSRWALQQPTSSVYSEIKGNRQAPGS
ncbi:immunoglobulin alpha-2 heavy chain-like [Scyliorhinus canicula]|uniref:immunoglobulin alpha-2 heavy chain-like n=1 Tax=Scyliorhinus canicula TaxID=7830 RepID=UPI0018F591A2|nr:immunoglobulin alpha-2 heavy chain-like [Scyliorhinus canicula]